MGNEIELYMRSEAVMSQFAEVLGKDNAASYISSVLLTVANDPTGKLQQCTPQSIFVAAMRAATLRLSVDASKRQAYIVPIKGKAVFWPGYKGFYDMAVRTGQYRYINVGKIYEGEEVIEDRITGLHTIGGSRTGDKVIGWLGAFEMVNGFRKTLYMTVEQIHAHAKRYNPNNYSNEQSIWRKDPEAMERKTVLRLLIMRWGYLDPNDASIIEQAEKEIEGEFIDAPSVDVAFAEAERRSENEIMQELGFETSAPKPKPGKFERPLPPAALVEAIAIKAGKYKEKTASNKQRGLVAMLLDKIFQDDDKRHTFQRYVFGQDSMKDVPDPMILAALDWLKPTQDSGGDYQPDPMAYKEAQAAYNEALLAEGQQFLMDDSPPPEEI